MTVYKNAGLTLPMRRLTVNLAPADLPKQDSAYDLPMAVGSLIAAQFMTEELIPSVFIGELSLDGRVCHIDGILVEVPRIEYEKVASESALESSESVRRRVEAARERQRRRFEGTRLACNAGMGPGEVRECCRLDDGGRSLLRSAMQQLQMSARAFHRILKLARTISRVCLRVRRHPTVQ